MRKLAAVIAVTVLGCFATPPATADGCFMPTKEQWQKRRERAYINEPEQKALICFRDGTEDLIISPSFEGDARDFAWVVPVPSRPKVEIVRGALFHELMRLVAPEPPAKALGSKGRAASAPQAAGVTVVEEKRVGAYRVAVLEATEGQALVKWLNTNGYHMPGKALGPVKQYVKERWTFVASKIQSPTAGAGLRTGTLAPLRLTFKARQPVYPMRLSATNPRPFKTLIYLAFSPGEIERTAQVVIPVQSPLRYKQGARIKATIQAGQKLYPTLAKVLPGGAKIFVQEGGHIRPEESTRDYVWAVPQGRSARR
jgi:hypothetical protein